MKDHVCSLVDDCCIPCAHGVGCGEALMKKKSKNAMHWNHRVMRHKSEGEGHYYAIHEVFYSTDGTGWTREGIAPLGLTKKELKKTLKRMLDSLDKPVLDYETGLPVKKKVEKENEL